MGWIGERVDGLRRRQERLSGRPLDADVLETLDEIDREVGRWQRLARLRGLPKRPTRIPVDASAVVARVARAIREEHPRLALELERPTARRRVLLDGPAVELSLRSFLDLLLAHAPSVQRLRIRLDLRGELELELAIDVDVADRLDDADPEEVGWVHESLRRAGLEWASGPTHRLRQHAEREDPITTRFVFPPPEGGTR
ncbi:MAG: hypothetical protein H6721_10230 [Sandaracinus sp.]|nr:hypothetical protein [Sandaracinus sp.]MCB9632494.1 hypothetical protein [Sandaracinus sp.]